ncbi:hypothetical protein B0H19DRAFT_1262051 [Mycena capillaripes]|nr:hypothetical protein B0H19DRAFT_1262051 [Mycena capillaripes]
MATHGGHCSLYTLDGGSIDGRFAPATPPAPPGLERPDSKRVPSSGPFYLAIIPVSRV